jgi:hypothetical protein
MNAYAVVLKPARNALLLFVLTAALAFAAVIGLATYRTERQASILQTERKLASVRDNIKKLTYDLDSINRLAAKYQRLSQLGFIGEPVRDGWVQRLEALYRDTRLPPTLRYTLAPPQLFSPQAAAPDAQTAYLNNIMHHDMNLELSGIHEGELLDFIDKLETGWLAPFRVETCQISREADAVSGLQIKCALQIYSLPLKP